MPINTDGLAPRHRGSVRLLAEIGVRAEGEGGTAQYSGVGDSVLGPLLVAADRMQRVLDPFLYYFGNETWLRVTNGDSLQVLLDQLIAERQKPVSYQFYEDHPVSFDAKRLGHSISSDVRRPLYWNLFNGAFGHTYGHHSVWQMWSPGKEPINNPLMPWFEAMDQPGATQMQHGRALIESRHFLTRIPDDSINRGASINRCPINERLAGDGGQPVFLQAQQAAQVD